MSGRAEMNVILTGKSSYISNSCCNFLLKHGHNAKCVSGRDNVDSIDFKGVDAIVHCAAIVHKKEADYADAYERVNYELTKELADKAKKSCVKQFVFLSTMAVYGVTEGVIDKNTPLEPKTLYGKSKLKAEKYIMSLSCDSFNVAVVRPPMVYGKACPGNYSRLSKIAKILPVIPDTKNKKSLIYIDNLAYLIYEILKEKKKGVFMPMDGQYISTAELMKNISSKPCSKILGRIVKHMPLSIAKKAFGTLYYDEDIALKVNYVSFDEAVRLSEQ